MSQDFLCEKNHILFYCVLEVIINVVGLCEFLRIFTSSDF
jgi:hypothetical protein